MRQWDVNKTDASTRAVVAGTDSSSNGDHNSGKKKKRPRDSKASPVTIVITDPYNFRAKVHKFTEMPMPPANSTSEETPPLLFKPMAQRARINVPLITLPFLSSVLTNSTNSCNLPLTDHLLKLPLIEGDHLYEAHTSNSMLKLPTFSENKANTSVSLLFKELLEELELTENAAI